MKFNKKERQELVRRSLRKSIREYAAARRKDTHGREFALGTVLGKISALTLGELLAEKEIQVWSRRVDRAIKAPITREPRS